MLLIRLLFHGFLALAVPLSSHAVQCADRLVAPGSAAPLRSAPLRIESILKPALDPSKVGIFLDNDHQGAVLINVTYGNQEAGHVFTGPTTNAGLTLHLDGLKPAIIGYIEVAEGFQGKGVGAMIYLLLARELAKTGYVLVKSDDTSAAADKAWASFARRSMTKAAGADVYIDPEFTADERLWTDFDEFIREATMNRKAFRSPIQ